MGPSIIDVLLEYYPIFLKGALGTLKIPLSLLVSALC